MQKKFDINKINTDQLDFFRELENVGAAHAATALSSLLGQPTGMVVPNADLVDYPTMLQAMGGPEELIVGLIIGMTGDINGHIILAMELEKAHQLSALLMEQMGAADEIEEGAFSDMQISALQEVGNILIGSYLTAICELTGLVVHATIPDIVIDMVGAIFNIIVVTYGEASDDVVFLDTPFSVPTHNINGHFFLVPDVPSYDVIMNKMGIL